MTPRALFSHLVFAALALGFAWQRANSDSGTAGGPSSMVLLEAKPGEIASVMYTWPKGTTKVEPRGSGSERAVVVDLNRVLEDKKEKQGPADGAEDKEGSPSSDSPPAPQLAAMPREQARFPGGKSVLLSLEALEPLKTRRTLGSLDAARLKAMGLETPERSLTITTVRSTNIVLDIGEQAYGGQGRYARVRGDSVVHLLDPAVVAGLEGTVDALLEKRIVTADVGDILSFRLAAGDKEKAYVHMDRDQPQKRRFAPRDDSASSDDSGGKVITSMRNLRGVKLVPEGELVAATLAARIQLEIDGRESSFVDIIERSGQGYAVRVAPWAWEVSETQARELLEDISGAMNES